MKLNKKKLFEKKKTKKEKCKAKKKVKYYFNK
jgi:hypothetical protein